METSARETPSDNTRTIVAANLAAELTRARWSDRKAATALGLSNVYVSRRTSGVVECSVSDLTMFASFLNIPTTRLLNKLPDLDSNQEPAGFKSAPQYKVTNLNTRRNTRNVHTYNAPATVTPLTLTAQA